MDRSDPRYHTMENLELVHGGPSLPQSSTDKIDELTVAIHEVKVTGDYLVDLQLRIKNGRVVRDRAEAQGAFRAALRKAADLADG
jgi:hypothetical protein